MVIQTLGLVLLAFLLSRSPGLATDDAEGDWSQVTFDDVLGVKAPQSDEAQPELGEVIEAATDTDSATGYEGTDGPDKATVDITDISWPDQMAPPAEIEPLLIIRPPCGS